ncbi:aminoacyl-tRNA hydrolase [Blochmannia endosymbiont of Colobopsis nipponica]|uniref:aminoacyl-tRNA hydrolase n=1 Tax=Blochmannia endosymbiont of Colobopsis nipponica TaxID=2681987 RepID=UPI00177D63B2|nr:aminoacyl-tRNA hydrolase [Blochmannia endosymbiont of Colobopsis nipponica]QOI11099.1 aminoacyl-tRNA hydrolase [Blochmannia endosymbiont of Colobopsis nipponica]
MLIKLIVGLGNYGCKYDGTRHNLGSYYVNLLAKRYKLSFVKKKQFSSLVGKFVIFNNLIHLLIPTTYMNLSGEAVAAMSSFYNFLPANILIVHDELDLMPGIIKLKFGGSHAGHNGLKNIINKLGCNQFYRLRIGIGRPKHNSEIVNFVLSKPPFNEKQTIHNILNKVINYTEYVVNKNIIQVMNKLHSNIIN